MIRLLRVLSAMLFAGCGTGILGNDDNVGTCSPACQSGQRCDTSILSCVCDNQCTTAGSICDPAGSGQMGSCTRDASTGCYSITGLAPCPAAGQTCAAANTGCTTAGSALQITTPSLSNAQAYAALSATLAATGGTAPLTWSIIGTGTLPSGMSLSSSGIISGTTTAVGTFAFTAQVKDSTGATALAQLSLTVTPGSSGLNVSVTGSGEIVAAIVDLLVDGGNNFPWEKVELPGAICGNGSQYKFFVNRTDSQNLLILLEGGGACWDYDTCSGRDGLLGAANPNGIADDYMQQFTAKYVSPIVNGADPGLPGRARTDLVTKGWNIIYMPYCTGDVHIGNKDATYTDPQGIEPPLTWHHNGYVNMSLTIDWARVQFPSIDKLLVTGFSAGGVGTSAAYWFIRTALVPKHGYMINDSGPVFPAAQATSLSRPLDDTIRNAWALDSVFDLLPPGFDRNDFGTLNGMVALAFPADQLAYTGYTRDYIFSRFTYERFLTPNDEESIHAYFLQDQNQLVAELEQYPNFSYFIPYHRPINSSHCTTIITFIGSHACQQMLKKKHWWEYLELPWGETWKCYSEFVPMNVFLESFINGNEVFRIVEPVNWYNNEDPGMEIVASLINDAING
jgi:hypothetical protein